MRPAPMPSGALQQAHHGERRDRLAAAAFADEPERLPARDLERDALDGGIRPAARREVDAEVVDGEEGVEVMRGTS